MGYGSPLGHSIEHLVIFIIRPARPFVQIIIDWPVSYNEVDLVFPDGSELPNTIMGHHDSYRDFLVGIWIKERLCAQPLAAQTPSPA